MTMENLMKPLGPLAFLTDEIRRINADHGWGQEYSLLRPIDMTAILCTNLHGEVSELWEAARKNALRQRCDKDCDLTNVEEEIADIIIRALDMAYWLGVDADVAIARKMAYNETRPIRHGGKIA